MLLPSFLPAPPRMKEGAADILRLAPIRDTKCAHSLRAGSIQHILDTLGKDKKQHYPVTLIGESAKCRSCPPSVICKCLKDHFQSTTNSKRRVSTYLFWKMSLGISFPVSDAMLERQVWSNLESCDQGIKRGNGQRKQKDGAVCVNPFHYHPAGDMTIILRPLVLTLDALGYLQLLDSFQLIPDCFSGRILSDAKVANILSPLKWDGKDFRNKKVTYGL
eukprot:m.192767 g.192767  ORF g.192767 m.192767 type:complete len:219 (+) comp15661_c0_seq5:399-1055(+)